MSASVLQKVLDIVFQYLNAGLRWVGRHGLQIMSTIFQTLKIGEMLNLVKFLVLQILKWYAIATAVVYGGIAIFKLGRWARRELSEYRNQQQFQANIRGMFRQMEWNEQQEPQTPQEPVSSADYPSERQPLLNTEARRKAKVKAEFVKWEQTFDMALRDKSTMVRFPFPELSPCADSRCQAFADTRVCEHNLESFFRNSGRYSLQIVKEHRFRWHPDKFECCREEQKQEFTKLANSLFVALGPMYERLKDEESPRNQ
ncbi:hypothetical protein HC256_006727 [Beauveria bassiana]|nr:hypothetical protein HC256_006727 [Beauveria bassiana]